MDLNLSGLYVLKSGTWVPVIPGDYIAPPTGSVPGWLRTAANTGLAAVGTTLGMLTTYSGGLTVTTHLYRQNIDLAGNQLVLGNGAFLEECYITGTRQGGQGQVMITGAGVQVKNCDLVGTMDGSAESIGMFGDVNNLQISSLRITGYTILMWFDSSTSSPASVIDSVYAYGQVASSVAHHDGFTRRWGNGPMLISNSRIVCDQGATTGSFFVQDTWTTPRSEVNVGHINVQNCYLQGNGYNATLELSNNLVFSNNRFTSTEYGPVATYNGPVSGLNWAGNYVYANNGTDYKGAIIPVPTP